MKPVAELLDVDDPAWPLLSGWVDSSDAVQRLPIDAPAGEDCLHRLQVSARSVMGAMALHTGGVLIDHGWLRLLGGGASGLVDLATLNRAELTGEASNGFLLVAFDVVGGRFAVNGGGLEGKPGDVAYWGPDSLTWVSLGTGYSNFVQWATSGGGVADFYADLRWDGWVEEVQQVRLDQGISVYPPLCTAESNPIESTSRRAVPWPELHGLLDELSGLPTGPFTFQVTD